MNDRISDIRKRCDEATKHLAEHKAGGWEAHYSRDMSAMLAEIDRLNAIVSRIRQFNAKVTLRQELLLTIGLNEIQGHVVELLAKEIAELIVKENALTLERREGIADRSVEFIGSANVVLPSPPTETKG